MSIDYPNTRLGTEKRRKQDMEPAYPFGGQDQNPSI
jgi:hypothetical protein